MARWILVLLAAGALQAQNRGELKTQRPAPVSNDAIEAPPEEDKSLSVTTYSFNPLQSEKDVRVGNYYLKTGNFKAAAGRRSTEVGNGAERSALLLKGLRLPQGRRAATLGPLPSVRNSARRYSLESTERSESPGT